jgi:signal transduction histidine kinase
MGVGLRGMRERVRRLSGEFQFRSGKNGTTVTATFPVPGATK